MWENVPINYWAVLVAGISAMVLGFIWYSLGVFGRSWMGLIGKTEEELKSGDNPVTYLWSYVLSVVTAYILTHFLYIANADTIGEGLMTAFWAWLGFYFTASLMNSMYEGRSIKLFWINGLYQLVSLAIMAIILVSWA